MTTIGWFKCFYLFFAFYGVVEELYSVYGLRIRGLGLRGVGV